jgi:hypothetical protein
MVGLRELGALCNASILFRFWSSGIVLPRIGAANRELNCRRELISADEDRRGRIVAMAFRSRQQGIWLGAVHCPGTEAGKGFAGR